MKRFEGRTVIVTGAASGIGRASAERIAGEGGFICAVDRNAEGLAETVESIHKAGGEATAHVCDLGDAAQIAATVAAVVEQRGTLHALCNVAGILRADHSHEIKLEAWETVLRVNLTGTFLMCQAAIPHLLKTKGAIVNTSSSAALGGHPWMTAYAASKGGILSMTRSLACEYGPQGLRVNTVVPGAIITPIHGGFRMPKGADAELIRRIIPTVPYGQPEQVAGAIAFFASDDANYCNGSELRVDGGMMS
jgi:short-subunit dehydrogenase